MHHFVAREVLPGVHHIRDSMGVFMTLLAGETRALLVDTGYGLEDVSAFVRTLTNKPVTVLLTHGHHDHALGARWFDQVMMFPAEHAVYHEYIQEKWRSRVANQAADKGLDVPEDFSIAPMAAAVSAEEIINLGGMTAHIRLCPGHTPGSAVIHVPERSLLLTGDDWNPCTWLFFPESLGAKQYCRNVTALLDLPFEHVLCSHREALYPRHDFADFVTGLTDETLSAAHPVDMGWPIDTREAFPAPGQNFVFDHAKEDLFI